MPVSSTTRPVALGFRTHSGWSAAVAVAGSPTEPVILERRRIETAEAGISGSKQPYHSAMALSIDKAETWIEQCRESSRQLASQAVSTWVDRLAQNGFSVVAAGILFGSGRPLADLSATLRSHALIHTAEGDFFRDVLMGASETCALPVTRVKEREIWLSAAMAFRLSLTDLQKCISTVGQSIGPPWRQDEKLASLAAWLALAEVKAA